MANYTFKNKHTTQPQDVRPDDAFAVKVVAVAGYNLDWAAYEGPTEWPDEKVIREGDKLIRKQAEPLFYVLRASGRSYRD